MIKINTFGHQDFSDLREAAGPIINVVLWWIVAECNSHDNKIRAWHNLIIVIFLHSQQPEWPPYQMLK